MVKVSGVIVSAEGRGNGPENMALWSWALDSEEDFFFLQKSGILKEKKRLAITYSAIWNRACLVLYFLLESYENIERKVGFCCFM